jgi:ACT domain-containing protein
MTSNHAVRLIAENRAGILRDIGALCAENNANINLIQQSCPPDADIAGIDLELDYAGDIMSLRKKSEKSQEYVRQLFITHLARFSASV